MRQLRRSKSVAELSEDSALEWEAAQWVASQMDDEPFDRDGFEAWLAADPRHQPLFDTMWQRIMGAKMDEALGAYARQRRSRRSLVAGSGAAVLLLFGGYLTLPVAELFLAQPQEYAARDGTIRQLRLKDGTRLTLAGGAVIRVRYTLHDREVELIRGTIFADVVHDGNRPFHVGSGKARITDVGTRFEVEKKPSNLRVTVEAGAVRFGTRGWFGKQIDLEANQAAMLSEGGLTRTHEIGANGIARWRTEWVEYRDTPLSQVIGDLESVSPLPIRIADKRLTALRVSGRIRLIDPVKQLNNLSIIHNFSLGRANGEIVLSKSKAGS
jgi:transmembrane sensor